MTKTDVSTDPESGKHRILLANSERLLKASYFLLRLPKKRNSLNIFSRSQSSRTTLWKTNLAVKLSAVGVRWPSNKFITCCKRYPAALSHRPRHGINHSLWVWDPDWKWGQDKNNTFTGIDSEQNCMTNSNPLKSRQLVLIFTQPELLIDLLEIWLFSWVWLVH